MKDKRILILLSIFSLIFSIGLAYLISLGTSLVLFGFPIPIIMVVLIFIIQLIGFAISNTLKTEKYFDITGGATFLIVLWGTLFLTNPTKPAGILTTIIVSIWALRLSIYLFDRVSNTGHDPRFDDIKISPTRFLFAWFGQGLWISISLLPSFVIFITPLEDLISQPLFLFGVMLWLAGFVIEVVADRQKTLFKRKADNKNNFINAGLWSITRHPNYFGEWLLWLGITISAIPSMIGIQFIALLSSLFTYLLLARGSGVPILEKRYQEKYGSDPNYQKYLKEVPEFFPVIWRSKKK